MQSIKQEKRIRRQTFYDNGEYIIYRSPGYNWSTTVNGDQEVYKVALWNICKRQDGYIHRLKQYEDRYYAVADKIGRLRQTKKMVEKCLAWLEHHQKLLSLNHQALRCDDIDGLGTHCPCFVAEDITCKVVFTIGGYTGGGGFSRPAPGECNGTKNRYSPCLPGGYIYLDNSLNYYWNIIRHNRGESHRPV